MQRLSVVAAAILLASSTTVLAATKSSPESTSPRTGDSTVPNSAAPIGEHSNSGRFQLVVAPGHSGSPFLLDTATGCIWHQVQNDQTKRTTFVEVDVENLHWSWGSGAQQILASRVDGSNLMDDQKRILKESLQKTGCGLSNVVLTPGPGPGQSPTGATPGGAPSSSK